MMLKLKRNSTIALPWNYSYNFLVFKDGLRLLEKDKITENLGRRSQKGEASMQ